MIYDNKGANYRHVFKHRLMRDHILEVELGEQTSNIGVVGLEHLQCGYVRKRSVIQHRQIKRCEYKMKISSHETHLLSLIEKHYYENKIKTLNQKMTYLLEKLVQEFGLNINNYM